VQTNLDVFVCASTLFKFTVYIIYYLFIIVTAEEESMQSDMQPSNTEVSKEDIEVTASASDDTAAIYAQPGNCN